MGYGWSAKGTCNVQKWCKTITSKATINMDLKRIEDEVKNDVVETYYDNGKLESRTNYKNGIKQ